MDEVFELDGKIIFDKIHPLENILNG